MGGRPSCEPKITILKKLLHKTKKHDKICDMSENQSSRSHIDRNFLRNLAMASSLLVGGVACAAEAPAPGPEAAQVIPSDSAPSETLLPETAFGPTFADETAEQAADALGINAGSYFKLDSETVQKVNASHLFATESQLLPVFPPAVMKNADIIERAAMANDIPPNVFASLASIESAGDPNAHSGADAWGLVQVVPYYHLERFVKDGFLPKDANFADYKAAMRGEDSRVSKETYVDALTNSEASATVGAEYFAECIRAARQKNQKLDPNDLRIYAIAAAAYNGGPSLAGQKFDRWPAESKLYVNHVSRFILDIEVAAKLRESGMDDKAVLRSMQSKEVEARAYAYSKFSFSGFDSYETRANLFTHPIPGVDPAVGNATTQEQQQALTNWQSYKDHAANIPGGVDNQYVIPAPPALRIWLAGGGMSLFAGNNAPAENKNWRLDN